MCVVWRVWIVVGGSSIILIMFCVDVLPKFKASNLIIKSTVYLLYVYVTNANNQGVVVFGCN